MQTIGKIIATAIAKELDTLPRKQAKRVEFTIKGSAIIRRGLDYEAVTVASIPFDKLFAHAMSHLNGVTVESIVREVLAGEVNSSEVKKQVDVAIRKIKGTSIKTHEGRVTVKEPVATFESLTIK